MIWYYMILYDIILYKMILYSNHDNVQDSISQYELSRFSSFLIYIIFYFFFFELPTRFFIFFIISTFIYLYAQSTARVTVQPNKKEFCLLIPLIFICCTSAFCPLSRLVVLCGCGDDEYSR